jgi:16S rRNA (uracil1498-N3)-methyltransferase
VLRLGPGDRFVLFDGQGSEVDAELALDPDGTARARVVGAVRALTPTPAAILVLALLKPGPMDDALRMATEGGATELVIFQADRSQGRPSRDDRWRRVVQAAARQCGRPTDPEIHVADHLAGALSRLSGGLTLYAADAMGDPALSATGAGCIVVGPEGGTTEREKALLANAGATPVRLGPWILRAETAAACATSWLTRGRES